ncbi:hypothetical protein [Amaricoccus solimangrovi]|uniref:Dystroglycan-type cadherin-like domain-containing protein n=1 Tax=Amaricoccus solimangrovi TaxID=2589815 RepID=A0A501WI04_9RHOB|nr:hypothetical protein [Amaricoccus solimangrovi]TPE48412.1 hypothetical protein FJM51_17770 [Amaricoccus solimangrovi]
MNASPDFTFSIAGEGIAIDPATGLLTIATEALMAGVGVVLTGRDASGAPTSAFRVTVRLGEEAEEPAVAAPSVTGALPDLVLVTAAESFRVETAGVFAGAGLGFSVAGGDGAIDPATGALDLPLGLLRTAETVTVTAANAAGAARASFALTILAMAPPVATGGAGDLLWPLAAGTRSVSTQAWFEGADLSYALEAAPEGVTILPGSGLVTIPTGAPLDGIVTVRAGNAGGAARQSFRVTVAATAPAPEAGTPAAAQDGEWNLEQVTE